VLLCSIMSLTASDLLPSSGQVLEQGTHNELLASPDGAYAALVAAQKLATMDDSNTLANNSSDEEINDPEKKIFTPQEAEDFAANEKPKMLQRASTTGGASLSSEALREGMKGESERAPTLGFLTIFRRLGDINRTETKFYILGLIASICSGMVYVAAPFLARLCLVSDPLMLLLLPFRPLATLRSVSSMVKVTQRIAFKPYLCSFDPSANVLLLRPIPQRSPTSHSTTPRTEDENRSEVDSGTSSWPSSLASPSSFRTTPSSVCTLAVVPLDSILDRC
jgi:hypothetical protein